MDDFMMAVAKFRANHPGRHAVLVFDNIDVISAGDPALLRDLQEFAKMAADDNLIKLIFVCSDGVAQSTMMSKFRCFYHQALLTDVIQGTLPGRVLVTVFGLETSRPRRRRNT